MKFARYIKDVLRVVGKTFLTLTPTLIFAKIYFPDASQVDLALLVMSAAIFMEIVVK